MQFIKLFRWPLLLSIFCLLGCSSLHIYTSSTIDWEAISSVVLLEPAQDPWELAPVIHTELKKMGFEVLSEATGDPDLFVQFFTKEGPDLDHEGNQTLRLLSVHIQLVAPATENFVSTIDYFYPEGEGLAEPTDGVKRAFAGLQDEIKAASSTQVQIDQKIIPEPAATSSTLQQENDSNINDKTVPFESTEQLLKANEQEVVPSATVQKPEIPQQAVTPETVKSKAPSKMPETRSPWLPRLHSWGFDTWGEETDDEE